MIPSHAPKLSRGEWLVAIAGLEFFLAAAMVGSDDRCVDGKRRVRTDVRSTFDVRDRGIAVLRRA